MATFGFIHGAGDVGWSWHLVERELHARGHATAAPDLPADDDRAGLAEYTRTAVEAIGDADDVIVVAHSLGGFTGPLVAHAVGARMMVFANGMVPLPGETAGEWWETSGYMAASPSVDMSDPVALFLHDVPPDLAAEALARGRDQSGTPMGEPWPLDALPDIPTRFLLFRDDRFLPAAFARTLARTRLGVTADEMDGSHCAMLSRPAELAARLAAYASA